jgi:ribonuclease Z
VGFTVQILGSGAALPTGQRAPSAQYLQCENRHFLIDCGEGTQMQFRRFNVKLQKIKQIFISHLHGDHFFGLPGLISTMHLLGRTQNLTIYGHPDLEKIIRGMLEVGGHKMTFEIQFVALKYDSPTLIFEDKVLEIWSFPLKHRIPTCGFMFREKPKEFQLDGEAVKEAGLLIEHFHRLKKGEDIELENGKKLNHQDFTFPPKPALSYAYCSDTKYFEDLANVVSNVDLLYHEATFTEAMLERAKTTFHSTAKQAAEIALQSKTKMLILGHFSSRYDDARLHLEEAKSIFTNSVAAEDGMLFDLRKMFS